MLLLTLKLFHKVLIILVTYWSLHPECNKSQVKLSVFNIYFAIVLSSNIYCEIISFIVNINYI
jgi:hypothetical protein